MARFQAKTNKVLEAELEEVRLHLGLRENQKAELLREITGLAAWVVRQAAQGRHVLARREASNPAHSSESEVSLDHAVLLKLVRTGQAALPQLVLNEEESRRLGEILGSELQPTAELAACLQRLADPEREPPEVVWHDAIAADAS